ncbi:hypothetical protein ACFVY0_39625 [Streptomyces sp. NPDC058286]|uniref:hypothetical protein n=1 Tax=Streptomyces sp. NPDC058286 TaxID=3346422 RepID=UPI0036E38635
MTMDVRGQWGLGQGNGSTVLLNVRQQDPDGSFGGTATVDGHAAGVTGKVTDSEIAFQVEHGIYIGRFTFEGRLTGLTVDGQNGHSQATWLATELFGPL